MAAAENVYNKRETGEQKEERRARGRGEKNEIESRKGTWPRSWNSNKHNIDKT